MPEKLFRFKHFCLKNEASAMKVNTDAVLLGAAVQLCPNKSESLEILDAGTGTGVIAMMLAQRLAESVQAFKITGIDIDQNSAAEAAENFQASPWTDNLQAINSPLQDFEGKFDLIVSNPPYYDESLPNPDYRRNLARHTGDSMSYLSLLEYAREHLKAGGRLAMVLPADVEKNLMRYARMYDFIPLSLLYVRTVERKSACRIVVSFGQKKAGSSRENPAYHTNNLIIQHEGRYTPEYAKLVKDFYLWA